MKKVLMVLTNASKIDDKTETGLWLSEFAEPYNEFKTRGYQVTAASPEGGRIPIDQNSVEDQIPDAFNEAIEVLQNTEVLAAVNVNDYNGIFLPGGHGTMFDLPDHQPLKNALQHFADHNKVIGAVCHGPAGFVNTKRSNGRWLVDGVSMTGFTNEEEQQTGLVPKMPFLLESRLREQGAKFEGAAAYTDHVITDGNFVTGQNPQSSQSAAEAFAEVLGK
ncbi:type 1 glutamine amidotransferase domain-containing protein [Metabacillus sp. GX 13764]|uniref:type 1 glutamine amidotransferase domain-containing protein n=1 Tax=Metabacillus kandeliae TaxID=2900151 RepID=UPI001E62041F|nr:type 1 glutamine amidotransferase domain-containing protein [Metabacillus kandeliae]MCD7035780.1 type 1 glutamine amidotransferase domain-containing protein [Metabacillus kandeliae]